MSKIFSYHTIVNDKYKVNVTLMGSFTIEIIYFFLFILNDSSSILTDEEYRFSENETVKRADTLKHEISAK